MGVPEWRAHAQEAQQLGAQGRTAAAVLPDRSQPARLSRGCRIGLPLSVFRRKFAKRSCIEQCSPLLARNSGQSQRIIPAMVILGELSDIFGDVQRGVWLEIRLRLRASSKLFSRHFLDRTRAFSGSRGAQPRRECQRKGFSESVCKSRGATASRSYALRDRPIGQNGKKVEATLPKR